MIRLYTSKFASLQTVYQ